MKISNYFSLDEFFRQEVLNDRGERALELIDERLVNRLEIIRNFFNKPVIINSAFRTESHNLEVGGEEYSQHKYGRAADIVIKDISPKTIQEFCKEQFSTGGLGCYEYFTHIDVRNNDKLIIWQGSNY